MKVKLEVNRYIKLILLFAVMGLLGPSAAMAEQKGKPNVLLIVMDATRADHLSCYGYNRTTTPHIDSLAKDGVIYENNYSVGIWSLPSMASMFTSSFPSQHGYNAESMIIKPEENVFNVTEEVKSEGFDFTLAGVLSAQGYKTVGFSGCPWVSRATNLNQGFEEFYRMWRDKAGNINRKVLSWLSNNYN